MTVTQLSDYLGLAMPPIFLAFSAAIAVCRLKHLEKQLKIMLHNFQYLKLFLLNNSFIFSNLLAQERLC
jgi:hypothetical protein